MRKIFLLIAVFLMLAIVNSCNKKSHPSRTAIDGSMSTSEVTKKAAVTSKPKATFPKVITVNDSAASKSVDGRLYYDVMGHRYWRNYKDGKYYLFNKSMYNDPAFKNPR